jgi:hypothetical protein
LQRLRGARSIGLPDARFAADSIRAPDFMGGGASKGKATGPSLLKAISNTDVANQLFDEINRDGDLNISIVEAYDAMKKYGEAVEAYWSLDMIKSTIAKYDTNQDVRNRGCHLHLPSR